MTHRLRLRHLPLLAALLAAAALLAPALARADSASTLSIVGTSDINDSGLWQNVLQPGFAKAYPQFTTKYKGTGTGAAVSEAESGADGASVLIVHAASLENQFVAQGYSYEKYGRAIFTNDFVLAGVKNDPAGVAANAPHNAAQAFADVASAGIAGKATFVSRGGTPGTTVEEHGIWQHVDSAHLAPSGLLLCALNATVGGGETPIAAGNGVTANGQPCPNGGGVPQGSQLPSWYVATGLSQGSNVLAANSCSFPNGGCYVLTDRGTYDYLASGVDPAGNVSNLTILSRDNSATAPGGVSLLVNYFHAYAINPAKPGQTVNVKAAEDFLNWLTSPAIQAAIGGYLAKTSDPGGAPFKPDASPIITIHGRGFPRQYHAGRPITISGTVANAAPGYPAPGRQPVSVQEVGGITPLPVATVRTSPTGAFRIRFVPPSTGVYAVGTPQIAQVEDAALSPVFGDILAPASTATSRLTVHAAVTSVRARSIGGAALVLGTVSPGTGHARATVTVLARRGHSGRFHRVAVDRLAVDDANFAVVPRLGAGSWQVRVRFGDGRQVIGTTSRTVRVEVGAAPPVRVRVTSVKAGRRSQTVTGTVSPKPSARSKVELLALRTSGTGARFVRAGSAVVRRGRFTIHTRLRKGYRWVLQVEDVLSPSQIAYSTPLRTIDVQ